MHLLQQITDLLALGLVFFLRQVSADQLETQIDQIGIQRVSLTIISYRLDLPGNKLLPDSGPADPHLAWESEQAGDFVQRRISPRLVSRQHIHEIGVALVIAV